MMDDKKHSPKMPHNIILEDRRILTVSGVNDVDSFDEQVVVLFTERGELTVKGNDLHINKLNTDSGDLSIEGEIHSLVYTDDLPTRSNSIFAKIFK